MRITINFVIAFLAIMLSLISVHAQADSRKALDAYEKGDFKAAMGQLNLCESDRICQFLKGTLYENGDGVLQNYKAAFKWYSLSANQDYGPAQVFLGNLYNAGRGVPQDFKEAAKWFRLAADQEQPKGAYNLAQLYYNGNGVNKNLKEAARLYTKAADLDDLWAQNNLAVLYFKGEGVSQNFVISYALLSLIASTGQMSEESSQRDKMLSLLSPADVSIGQRMANEMDQSGSVSVVINRYLQTGR